MISGKIQEGMWRVGKLVKMMDLWRGVGVAEIGIEGEGGVAAKGLEEVMGAALSKFLVLFFLDLHTNHINRKSSVQRAQEDMAADRAGPPAKLSV
jgi:hypothetical protein